MKNSYILYNIQNVMTTAIVSVDVCSACSVRNGCRLPKRSHLYFIHFPLLSSEMNINCQHSRFFYSVPDSLSILDLESNHFCFFRDDMLPTRWNAFGMHCWWSSLQMTALYIAIDTDFIRRLLPNELGGRPQRNWGCYYFATELLRSSST